MGLFGTVTTGAEAFKPFGGLDMNTMIQKFAPKTSQEVTGEINTANTSLPGELQIGAANISPAAIAAAENNYKQMYVRPQVEQVRANLSAEGRDNSTFGGAELGAVEAMGNLQAYQAGQDAVDRALARWAQKRQSYMNMPFSTASGAATAGSFIPNYMQALLNAWQTGQRYNNQQRQGLWDAGIGLGKNLVRGVSSLSGMFGSGGGNTGRLKASDPAPKYDPGPSNPWGVPDLGQYSYLDPNQFTDLFKF